MIVGLIFSNQILGIGHNLGLSNIRRTGFDRYFEPLSSAERNNISILGMDYLASLGNDDEGFISSIIPSVPVMIRTLKGWRFEAPSNQQRSISNGNKTAPLMNWF